MQKSFLHDTFFGLDYAYAGSRTVSLDLISCRFTLIAANIQCLTLVVSDRCSRIGWVW
jgi:hypothetical protein